MPQRKVSNQTGFFVTWGLVTFTTGLLGSIFGTYTVMDRRLTRVEVKIDRVMEDIKVNQADIQQLRGLHYNKSYWNLPPNGSNPAKTETASVPIAILPKKTSVTGLKKTKNT